MSQYVTRRNRSATAAFIGRENTMDWVQSQNASKRGRAHCPSCGRLVPVDEMREHLEYCDPEERIWVQLVIARRWSGA